MPLHYAHMKSAVYLAPLCCCVAAASLQAASLSPSPDDHATAYKAFSAKLDEQLKSNEASYLPAMEIVFSATQDELAGDAWMEKAAASAHPVATLYCAERKLNSTTPEELTPAIAKNIFAQFKKSADADFVPAMVMVARCQHSGMGCKADPTAAKSSLIKGVKMGNSIARFKLLQMMGRLKKPADLDRKEVIHEMQEDNVHVLYVAAIIEKDPAKRVAYLRRAAELGNAEALYLLSSIVAKNNASDSYTLLVEAARKSHPMAMATVGAAMIDPKGIGPIAKNIHITKDEVKGMKLLKLSTMLDSSLGSMLMGQYYYRGEKGLSKDMERSYTQFKRAAYIGDQRSMVAYAFMLMQGMGCEKNPAAAENLLKQLANRGMPQATLMLAYGYYKGFFGTGNLNEAILYLKDAAANRMPIAYLYIALIYEKGGKDFPANPKEAAHYVRLASLTMDVNKKGLAQKIFDDLVKQGDWTPNI